MSNYVFLCAYSKLATLNNVNHKFENIKIVDILKSGADHSRSKPKSLRYFKIPKATAYPIDLNEGYEEYVHRKRDFPHSVLHLVENYLMANNFENSKPEIRTKICARRSTLIKIMSLTFNKSVEEVTFNVSKFKDTMYITEYKKPCDLEVFEGAGISNSHHFKFEQICFSDKPSVDPVTDVPIDENEQLWCTFRAQFNQFEMIYSAEVLGVESEGEINDLTNMEVLNDCRFILLRLYKNRLHPIKLITTALQAKMANVEHLYLAQKSESGFITTPIEHVHIGDIVQKHQATFDRGFKFLYNFLSLLDERMTDVDCPYTVYQIKYQPKEKCLKMRILLGKNEFSFLADKFIEHLKK